MRFIVSSDIRVSGYGLDLLQYCSENLTVDNPDYIKKEKLGKWLGRTPKKLYMYKQIGNELVLPFGCLKYLWDTYKGQATFEPRFKPTSRIDYDSKIKLYDYQEKAVNMAVSAKNGVVIAPCGAGKTQIGLEIASRIGGRTLWLTHKADLLEQSMSRAKSVFGLDDSEYGTITAGKITLGNTMTFATVQTMANLDLKQFANYFTTIIVDEAHHCVGTPTALTMFYKILSDLSARYKFGLTASEHRSDGLHKTMFYIIGEKIVEISRKEVEDKTCPVIVNMLQSGYEPNMRAIASYDGTFAHCDLLKDMIENTARNEFIVNEIKSVQGSVLVLSDRKAHLETLYKMLNEPKSTIIKALTNSKKVRAEREQVLKDLNNGDLRVVFATYSLAKEGLDVPNLRYVVLATPQKDKITVTQSAGRVGRKAENKDCGRVIDILDNFGYLYGYAKKRKSIYKKLGYTICEW